MTLCAILGRVLRGTWVQRMSCTTRAARRGNVHADARCVASGGAQESVAHQLCANGGELGLEGLLLLLELPRCVRLCMAWALTRQTKTNEFSV